MARYASRHARGPRHLGNVCGRGRHARRSGQGAGRRRSRRVISIRVLCSVAVVIGVVMLASPPAPDVTATSITSRFNPDADAYVSEARPNDNFGRSLTLRSSALPRRELGYVRFHLTQLTGSVIKARLRLYGQGSNRSSYTVRSAPTVDWREDQITYANAPPAGPTVVRSEAMAPDSWTSVDVTPMVHAGGTVTLVLTASSASAAVYGSRESGGTAPQLVVETRVMPGAATTTGTIATAPTVSVSRTTREPTTTKTTISVPTTTRLLSTADSPGPAVTGADRFGIAAGCCIQWLSPMELARELDDYKALGVRWLRFDMAWNAVQDGGPDSYNWTPYDRLVRAANSRGIRLLGMIGYTPAWARPADCRNDDKCAPANVDDFAFFAGQAARRYRPLGLHAWEIWNEENGSIFWKPAPDPAVYARMLKASYTAIKQNDADAWVVTGGLSPNKTDGQAYSPVDYLQAVYQHGAKGAFDAVGAHPYCWAGSFDCPNQDATWSAWSQMARTRTSLRSIMITNGDQSKRIWGTEYGAPTAGGREAVGEDRQANQLVNGYRQFSSQSWTGPLFWYSYQDACPDDGDTECHFGLVRRDGSPKPAHAAYRRLT